MASVSFQIRGMDCAEETAALRSALSSVTGIQEVTFDLLSARMTVRSTNDRFPTEEVLRAVKQTGMSAEFVTDAKSSPVREHREGRSLRAVLTIISAVLAAFAFLVHGMQAAWQAALTGQEAGALPTASRLLYLAAIAAGGWFVAPKAWLAARRLRPDMHLLMTVAVFGAVILGEYLEAATVTVLFSLSLTLEHWSVARARRAVAELLALAPPKARVLQNDGSEQMLDAEAVPVGSRIVIKPGEKYPLDGRVLEGQTTVNQAPITGESMPVTKTVGSEVFAGTINVDGAVLVATTKPVSDTTLARIIRMVSEAQSRRAPSEQWVEQFARIYTPVVLCLALLVAIIPPLLLSQPWATWFYQALVLLVIACPCALVISTPVTIVAALVAAARHGILIKGGLYMEVPARLRAVALDKTGTLTMGRPRVQKVVPLSGHSERELLEIAASVEMRSQHPLAQAVVQHATAAGIAARASADFQAIAGKGATAIVNGNQIWIGSHRLLEERSQETPELHEQLTQLSASGASVVVIGEEHHVCGFIAVSDTVRPEARNAVAELKSLGINPVVMLTGDNRGTAETIARETGVDEINAELLPEAKVKVVEDLVRRFGVVAMVGDGVNDAPAMAQSSLGIAMGAIGTDAAIETADIALMTDDLSRLPWLIRHSRRALRTIRANIAASLVVKAAFVCLTVLGKASLWAAIAADTGVSLLVVLNALRLLRTTEIPRIPDHA
ncbi:putative cadmium-transporting ATPase [Phycisphaerae bacterium RAS2]|nr:putative cadmium-transporting ATPase [Phycisphaerae bacterium RAS2]